ncbi:ATP-grasp domain-containing protein [Aquibacillus sp. 3ASR75-11]|uniref:ATP-grasp domain-containing protein n=1 Tax=Terrihalobacillus insolitus TaxID=2950438 RepID=A0A9X3WUZ9_9BACI|nr:ATP-grasp domain-containing protein [Terrihalobacillus insolitus]MDC3412479.1 ATP-grasp domain-containing protein [Terrihalobacillus insolitus]MDC3423899.1 ATP-grasp domain-containing protein [Terrihalobacillus insolitus]
MKKGWILYRAKDAKRNQAFIQWFQEESLKQSLSLELVFVEDLMIGIIDNQLQIKWRNRPVILPDFAIVRTMDPLLSQQLELLGIPVFNSSTVSRICNDKTLTHQYLATFGLSMMDTIFLHGDDLPTIKPPISFPFVIKPTNARSGNGVYMIRNQQDWNKTRNDFSLKNVLIQSCDVQVGKDLRVFVVGKEIVGAVLRENKTDFKANFSLGGTATWYDLANHEIELIEKIMDVFDFGMVGIDFLIGNDGELLFNEIEDVVGSRTLSNVSSVNIVEKYVALIHDIVYRQD